MTPLYKSQYVYMESNNYKELVNQKKTESGKDNAGTQTTLAPHYRIHPTQYAKQTTDRRAPSAGGGDAVHAECRLQHNNTTYENLWRR